MTQLKPNIKYDNTEFNYTKINGVNPKKLHEINNLSYQINLVCQSDIDVLIDLGSGLGYLSQMLNTKYQYKILGLEADAERVATAKNRQMKYFPNSINCVQFCQHFITEESDGFIKMELMKNNFCKNASAQLKIGIIGLHACADLTITAIKLFLNMNVAKHLVIMPCCYHKMTYADNQCVHFKNIPLSTVMESIFHGGLKDIICRPFLRLASQQTAARWKLMSDKEHFRHGQNMFERAALDMILKEGQLKTNNKNLIQ